MRERQGASEPDTNARERARKKERTNVYNIRGCARVCAATATAVATAVLFAAIAVTLLLRACVRAAIHCGNAYSSVRHTRAYVACPHEIRKKDY